MKKITLFAFLAVPLFSLQMRGQDLQTRSKVIASYDLVASEMIVKEIVEELDKNKELAIKTAIERGSDLTGVGPYGNHYELIRLTKDGYLLYRTTFSAGSRVTAKVEGLKANNSEQTLLEGEDMIFGVVDGMSALGDHQEFAKSTADPSSRLVQKDKLPVFPKSEDGKKTYEDRREHATHVAGIIGAGGYYRNNAKGLAPKATILSYNWNSDLSKMREMAAAGVLVSNHSYGLAFFDKNGNLIDPSYPRFYGVYIEETYNFDLVANQYPYYLPVVAAGNDGDNSAKAYLFNRSKRKVDMLAGTSVAKNVVVVAATHQVDNYTGPADVKLAYFSSQGPTDDFRIKPDIAAKGDKVFAPIYENPKVGSTLIATDQYDHLSGTSMAAPAVSAVFGLWQEWATKYNTDKLPYKAATIRALMAHTADEAGAAPGPDHFFGWGLINATSGIQVLEAARDKGEAQIFEEELSPEEQIVKKFVVKEAKSKLVVTLAWNDPAYAKYINSISGYDEKSLIDNPTLVNDLDVVVKNGDNVYYPWRLTKDFSNVKAEKGDNNVDNIEKIEIEDVDPGTYEIVISHKNALLGGKNQAYSLVVSAGEFSELLSNKNIDNGDVDPITGETITSNEFAIWPNPVANDMFVNLGSKYAEKNTAIRVFDIDGRMVRDFKGTVDTDGKVTVNMASLSSGSYFVEVKTADFKKKVRIMKR